MRRTRAMGSACEVQIALADGRDTSQADDAIHAALSWIVSAEARLSRFQPTSELCALNRAAGTLFHASADLFALVTIALRWAEATQGLFDPTLLIPLEAAGYRENFETMSLNQPASATKLSPTAKRFRAVTLDSASRTILLPVGIGIDLGGIGKGWAADQVLSHVLGDFPNVLVNIGGDLAMRGGPTPDGWIVGVRDPRHAATAEPIYIGGVQLRAGGIATSGAAWRWWRQNGQLIHHLIDPRTGLPATTVGIDATSNLPLSVTALAHSATEAEVRAKEALLLGPGAGLIQLGASADRAGFFIFGNGRVEVSANLHQFLHKQRV